MRTMKITSVILAVLMMIMMMCPSVMATTNHDSYDLCVLGDANVDTEVNIKDATEVQKHVAGLVTLTEKGFVCADVNGDTVVNVKDATEIQKHLAGFFANENIGKETEVSTEPETTTQATEPTEETATDIIDALNDLSFWIDMAEGYLAPGNNYISETAIRLQSEIDTANELFYSDDATYEEVVAQTKALQDAVDGLQEPYLDRDELWAVIERGIKITENGEFTEESYEAYSTAYGNAMIAYHYGQSQEEVYKAKADLEAAIDGLVPVNDDSDKREIDFTVAEEYRINYYGSENTELHLITSVAEMEAVLATIEGEEYGSIYTTPVVSPKYNDAYFENNSLIISLNVVGGSCCTQTIDSITTENGVLTVNRTIYKPFIVLPDMNYQYVLIEVSSEDVKNAESLVNNTTYVYLDEDATEPTDKTPLGETITVYFSNSQYWSNVNIHYWGGEINTSWPGYEMEFVENNVYGQDVYKYTIPADTTGIVFNEGVNMAQTVDVVTDIIDGYGFYPTETENGKWKVESYIYTDKEADTAATTEATTSASPTLPTMPVIIPDTTAPEDTTGEQNSVSFTVAEEFRVNGYGSETTELHLITSVAEMEAVLATIEGEEYGSIYTTPVVSPKYNDVYFQENSLIVALYSMGSGSYSHSIDKLTTDGNTLTIHRSVYMPEIFTCDMNYRYVLLEVSSSDVAGVTTLNDSNTYITVR